MWHVSNNHKKKHQFLQLHRSKKIVPSYLGLFFYKFLDTSFYNLSWLAHAYIALFYDKEARVYRTYICNRINDVTMFIDISIGLIGTTTQGTEHFCFNIFLDIKYIFVSKSSRINISHNIFCVRLEYGHEIITIIVSFYCTALYKDHSNTAYRYTEYHYPDDYGNKSLSIFCV